RSGAHRRCEPGLGFLKISGAARRRCDWPRSGNLYANEAAPPPRRLRPREPAGKEGAFAPGLGGRTQSRAGRDPRAAILCPLSKGSSWFPPISYEPRMGSKEDAGKGCPAAGGVSSFTIQSILGGGPSEVPREPAGWPARKRSLSVSSEEEEPDDGWKAPACFCPDPHGPKEPGPKHHPPIPFPCLGKDLTPPPGRPRASSRGGKPCRGPGPLWPEPRPPRVQGGGEGTRVFLSPPPGGGREVTGNADLARRGLGEGWVGRRVSRGGLGTGPAAHTALSSVSRLYVGRILSEPEVWKSVASGPSLEAANMAHASAQTLVGMPLVFRDSSLLRVPVPRSLAFPAPLYYPGANLSALPLY
ncbi:HMX2 protein, partial [Crocuta crocuta]